MVNYTCQICLKEFNKKSTYIYHTENKKKPCKKFHQNPPEIHQNPPEIHQNPPEIHIKLFQNLSQKNLEFTDSILEYKCEYCNKNFSRQDALKRHIDKRCKIKKENDDNNKQTGILIDKVKELEKVIEELKNNQPKIKNIVINTNNNSTNVTNVTNIKLNAFGNPDLSKIDLETKLNFLNTLDYPNIIPNYAKHALLNDKIPENKHFKVLDIARNKCEYYNGEKWIKDDANKCTTQIMDYLKDSLQDLFNNENCDKTIKFIQKNKEKLSQRYINYSKNFCFNLDKIDDKEYRNHREDIVQQLRYIFYNHKDEILSNNLI